MGVLASQVNWSQFCQPPVPLTSMVANGAAAGAASAREFA
jgi:hypothetical protein